MAQAIIWNRPDGNNNGNAFKAVELPGILYLSSIKIWTRNSPGDHEVIRGIELEWTNRQGSANTQKKIGDTSGTSSGQATIGQSERITDLIVYAGDWVDCIFYKSTNQKDGKRLGGSSGYAHPQDIGNGAFLGLWGRESAWGIDALGGTFFTQLDLYSNNLSPNASAGVSFIGQPGTDEDRVSSIKVWTHNGPGDHQVLTAIELVWSNGRSWTFGDRGGSTYEATFTGAERITEMSIHAGDYVDAIAYKSTVQTNWGTLGGSGGKPNQQNVGKGIFVGLWGRRSGASMSALGGIFEK